MNPNNDNNSGLSVDIGDELSKNLTIHKNVKQEIIISTSDKIKLVLINTREILTSQRDWWTPFGLLVSFVATLCTADFKDALGFKKEFWHAIFVILSIASAGWLFKALYKLYKNWGQDDLSKIIEQIQLKNNTIDKDKNDTSTEQSSEILISQSINILSATYAWLGGQVDVTAQIKNLVSRGIYTIMVDPGIFGIKDPAWGVVKTLHIHCKINGQEREFVKKDGERFRME